MEELTSEQIKKQIKEVSVLADAFYRKALEHRLASVQEERKYDLCVSRIEALITHLHSRKNDNSRGN